jgi:ADP-ribosyl-[dinitrogen reductase] hydrolase
MKSRYLGSLLGLTCGDAVGTTVEFKSRGTFEPITDMVGGGPFDLQPGEWTDDTSMALCLTESLLETGGFSPKDQSQRYLRWYREGHLSSTGHCFDIGNATSAALRRFESSGNPYSGSTDPYSAGNGSIMRLAPVPMYFLNSYDDVIRYSADSSRTTHAALEAVDACKLFGLMIALALKGENKEDILKGTGQYLETDSLSPNIAAIARMEYQDKSEDEVIGSGYVVKSLEAALWIFQKTDTFEDAVLAAVNLGDDADTTGAVVGQIAGAHYGVDTIPSGWLEKLKYREQIETFATRLYQEHPGESL